MIKIILYSILGFLTFGIFSVANCQTKLHKLSVQVNRDDFGYLQEYWNKVQLVSDDTTITNYLYEPFNPLKIDSIPSGKYKVILTSVFNHVLIDSLDFSRRISNKMYFDKTVDYYQISDKDSEFWHDMKTSDTLTILFSEQGCFHMDGGKIQIIKTDDSWIAQRFQIITGDLLEQRVIDRADFLKIVALETYINQNKDSYDCTTVAYYTIQYKRMVKRFIDGSCAWDGYKKLKEDIFN